MSTVGYAENLTWVELRKHLVTGCQDTVVAFREPWKCSQPDECSLGLHIANEHVCTERVDLNRLYIVQILENCGLSTLEKKEHCFIYKFHTLSPIHAFCFIRKLVVLLVLDFLNNFSKFCGTNFLRLSWIMGSFLLFWWWRGK